MQPPLPGDAVLTSRPPLPTAKPKRDRAVAAQNTAIRVEPPAISELLVGDTMGVAGRLAKLYEAKWTQSFLPISLSRGFKFAGEFTCEEIRVEIQKMALESGCNFWKTDSSKIESLDGYVQSITFKCPHFHNSQYYIEKKGRRSTEDSHELWRNESRQGQHVTGTLCGARFTINGKKTESDGKFISRISPLMRAKFSKSS
jgi:hypothetical protein